MSSECAKFLRDSRSKIQLVKRGKHSIQRDLCFQTESVSCIKQEIRLAYLKLCQKYHPDKVISNDDKRDNERFQKINEAYNCLSKEGERSRYDFDLSAKKTGPSSANNFWHYQGPYPRPPPPPPYARQYQQYDNFTRMHYGYKYKKPPNGNVQGGFQIFGSAFAGIVITCCIIVIVLQVFNVFFFFFLIFQKWFCDISVIIITLSFLHSQDYSQMLDVETQKNRSKRRYEIISQMYNQYAPILCKLQTISNVDARLVIQ